MVDFRKALLLVVLLVAMTGIASAQFINPLQCTINATNPPIARQEGLAEEVGQILIVCTGGTPTAKSVQIPRVNVQVYLNTNITSRIYTASGNIVPSEALLLIDEPNKPYQDIYDDDSDGDRNEMLMNTMYLCPATTVGGCAHPGATGNGKLNYTGNSLQEGRYNIYQGQKAQPSIENQISFLGVPIDPPGSAGQRVIRIVNLRANASTIQGGTFIPGQILAFVSITGTGSLPISVQQTGLVMAYVQEGMKFSASGSTFNQCEPPGTFTVTFDEQFATAFRDNNTARDIVPAGGNGVSDVNEQNVPGSTYNSESMFSGVPDLTSAGTATQGTRLIVKFSNVPVNINLAVSNSNTSGSDVAVLVTGNVDSNGNGGAVLNGYTWSPQYVSGSTSVTLSGGAGYAVWEIIGSNPGQRSGVTFTVTVTYTTGTLPGLGEGVVAGNYAPISGTGIASTSAPRPRFVEKPQSAAALKINPCQTNLLFPYVAHVEGALPIDTGIAISNTTMDPYSTPYQRGSCDIYYYGTNAPQSKATSHIIEAGAQLLFTLSAGNAQGIAPARGFVGYIIARCNFQYGHGYAFLSDPGIKNWAQGYVALVLDQNLFDSSATQTRTKTKSEVLGN